MDETEILKVLFEEHHRQLAAKREKIHSISERTLAILLVIAGWMILTDRPISGAIQWVIIGAVSIIAGASCFTIYNNNRNYFAVAGVVRKINYALGLFEPNRFGEKEPLYPDSWKDFGERGRLRGFLPHWVMVIATATLCIVVAILKAP